MKLRKHRDDEAADDVEKSSDEQEGRPVLWRAGTGEGADEGAQPRQQGTQSPLTLISQGLASLNVLPHSLCRVEVWGGREPNRVVASGLGKDHLFSCLAADLSLRKDFRELIEREW